MIAILGGKKISKKHGRVFYLNRKKQRWHNDLKQARQRGDNNKKKKINTELNSYRNSYRNKSLQELFYSYSEEISSASGRYP